MRLSRALPCYAMYPTSAESIDTIALDDYETKLQNLKLFYDQAIPIVGWEKYSVISLKYKNQIVCTKK